MAGAAGPGDVFAAAFCRWHRRQAIPLHGVFDHQVQIFLIAPADHGDFISSGQDIRVVTQDLALVDDKRMYLAHYCWVFCHRTWDIYPGYESAGPAWIEIKETNFIILIASSKVIIVLGDIDKYLAPLARS